MGDSPRLAHRQWRTSGHTVLSEVRETKDAVGATVISRYSGFDSKPDPPVLRRKSNQASRGNFLKPIFMMQSAEYVLCSYSTIQRQLVPLILSAWQSLYRRFWNPWSQTCMWASAIVMCNPLPQYSPQMPFAQRDHPV